MMKTVKSNICSIKLHTYNSDDETQTIRLVNVYNLCSLSFIFTEKPSTISRLNEMIKSENNSAQIHCS